MYVKLKGLLKVYILFLALTVVWGTGHAQTLTDKKTISLGRDIQSINLVNSLYLTPQQIQELLPILKEVKQMEDDIRQAYESREYALVETLNQMKSQLKSSIDVSEDLKRKYHRLETPIKQKMVNYHERMQVLADKAYDILNQNQKVLLREYEPCIIPHRSVTNPERIGQAGGNKGLERLLERVRHIPPDIYPRAKQRIMEKAKQRIKMHIKDKRKREETIQRLSKAMDEVRSLSDEEFELRKGEIASQIKPEHKNKCHNKKAIRRMVIRYLLNPNLIPILEYKITTANR